MEGCLRPRYGQPVPLPQVVSRPLGRPPAPQQKNEKEANIMSYTVTGSPFLVSMGDLQRENAHQAQEIASLKKALATVNKENDRLRQTIAESKKQ